MGVNKKIGFNFRYLPYEEDHTVDFGQLNRMVDRFLEEGFTYFDTSWSYRTVNRCLVIRKDRSSFQIATKSKGNTKEEISKGFDLALASTEVEYFDFYILKDFEKSPGNLRIWEWAKEMKREGKIKYLILEYYIASPKMLEDILKDFPEMDGIQLYADYAEWSPEVNFMACYDVARKYGKMVIAEIVYSGMFTSTPEVINQIFIENKFNISSEYLSIKFASSLDGVIAVLPKFDNKNQMEDVFQYMNETTDLTEVEKVIIDKARKVVQELPLTKCTLCGKCSNLCSKGLPGVLEAMDVLCLYNDFNKACEIYTSAKERGGYFHGEMIPGIPVTETRLKGKCSECGMCEKNCPANIEIRKELEKADNTLKYVRLQSHFIK